MELDGIVLLLWKDLVSHAKMKTLYEYLARLEYDNGWEEARRILDVTAREYTPQVGTNYASYLTTKLQEQDRIENGHELRLTRDWA